MTALGVGEMGIGNTTTSAAVLAVLTGADIDTVAGRGGGLTDEGFARKKAVLRQAVTRRPIDRRDVLDVLAAVRRTGHRRHDRRVFGLRPCAYPGGGGRLHLRGRRRCAPCVCALRRRNHVPVPRLLQSRATAWRRRSWA